MAERDNDIDELFRDGLARHSEIPSPMGWEKLEGKLSERNGERPLPWRRMVATLLLLAGASIVWWYSVGMVDTKMETLAEDYIQEEPESSIDQTDGENIPSLSSEEAPVVEDAMRDSPPPIVNKEPAQPIRNPTTTSIAMNDEGITPERGVSRAPVITKLEPSELALPERGFSPKVNGAIHKQQEGEVAYTVTIISNGITEKPAKDNLVKEIEDKIDKLGGMVYRMDQGFADLQDAKNGLFASLTSKDGNRKSK